MMSISPGMSAGHAGGYFSREDYYLHGDDLGENSLWLGKGSRELGLAGPVREEEFRALCRGEDPAGNRLVSPKISAERLADRAAPGRERLYLYPSPTPQGDRKGAGAVSQRHHFCGGGTIPRSGCRKKASG